MPVSISGLTIRLGGHVAADITRLEVNGTAVTIADDRSWTEDITVLDGTRTVTVTAIGPTRIDARSVEIGSGVPPIGIG